MKDGDINSENHDQIHISVFKVFSGVIHQTVVNPILDT